MKDVPVLFDVNAGFGKPVTGPSDFPAIRDRLDFMDRFGVDYSLVWNIESMQGHALSCNERMIDEIMNTPGAKDRIVPALAVSGLMTYEKNGIGQLIMQMKAARTRALRFAGFDDKLTLCQLSPVMRKIRDLKPFIVMRYDRTPLVDILDFTEEFPDVPLVLTEGMWPPFIKLLDLLRRRKNIILDTSWQHTYGAVEMVVKHFGAERLLFGMGTKAHNAAALAALAKADITEKERDFIAYGNLARLTGRQMSSSKKVQITGNKIWLNFLHGRELGADIIDAHVHIGPLSGYLLEAESEDDQICAALRDMKRSGISRMIASGTKALLCGDPVVGNDLLEKKLMRYSDDISGYVAFNPFFAKGLAPHLDRYFAGPVFVGFKTLCDYWNVKIDDERFESMWEYADRHCLPILNHTWESACDSPSMLDKVAGKYRNAVFLVAHSGGTDNGRHQAEELARKHKNVYLEWCGSFCSSVLWEETIGKVGAKQVVFGTDAMAHDINWELGRLLSLGIPQKDIEAILSGNMRRILGMRKK